MQYAILIHIDETPYANASAEANAKMSAPYDAYTQALVKAGALVGGERLAPSKTAALVRVRGEKTEVIDGPFADSKEQLAGFYLIEAPDHDSAIAWAARCPAASNGTVELRQVVEMKG